MVYRFDAASIKSLSCTQEFLLNLHFDAWKIPRVASR
jgi:hypothetical protein